MNRLLSPRKKMKLRHPSLITDISPVLWRYIFIFADIDIEYFLTYICSINHYFNSLKRDKCAWPKKWIIRQNISLSICHRLLYFCGPNFELDCITYIENNTYSITDEKMQRLKFIKFKRLELTNCLHFKGHVFRELKPSHLQQIHMCANMNFRDDMFKYLKELPQLSSLAVTNSRFITGIGLSHLQNSRLTNLDFSNCRNICNTSLKYLKTVPLRHLTLKSCVLITDAGLACLQHIPLQSLDLGYCHKITNIGLSIIQNMPLRDLNIQRCISISSDGILYLQNMPLQTLNVSGCVHLTSDCLKHIKCCVIRDN